MEKTKNPEADAKNRKILACILVFILILIGFIVSGVVIRSTPESRETAILKYLKEKYQSEFEIVGLVESGKENYMDRIDCDGSTCVPDIRRPGAYFYRYDVRSLKDNIIFSIEYIDAIFSDNINEGLGPYATYESKRQYTSFAFEIANQIKEILEDDTITFSFHDSTYIDIYSSKNLEEIYNEEYITKLEEIEDLIKRNTKEGMTYHGDYPPAYEDDKIREVDIIYNPYARVEIHRSRDEKDYWSWNITIYPHSGSYCSKEEYLERLVK